MIMPRHEPKSDEAIEVRSVLMRLYHSRQMGEAFYPAQLVNGHAPQMEADGWIEWCGQGWRMTDAGLKVWAEMNPSLITHKFQSNKQFFEEMRHVLRGEDQMAGKTCIEEGCPNPRFVTEKGEEHSRCEMHQREKWNREAKAKREKKANQPPPQPSPASDGGLNKLMETSHQAFQRLQMAQAEKVDRVVQEVIAAEQLYQQRVTVTDPLPMDTALTHDCEHCEAKAIIGMLKSRSPRLAALIEAMEDVQRKADDLGL